jgi:hypothetical protein
MHILPVVSLDLCNEHSVRAAAFNRAGRGGNARP